MTTPAISLSPEQISDFCQRWKVLELALFGSVLREDFRSDSDVDMLVTFAPDADWSLLDHVQMEEELGSIIGRKVDLVSRRAIERSENWIRRQEILETAEVIYVAR
ncbi:MAG: nucleotidyltransferase domain-containing protein [Nitrospinae bacterium]|nr:nucleotidyltransferase domain-containing protein [Nitrospinota bacterium]